MLGLAGDSPSPRARSLIAMPDDEVAFPALDASEVAAIERFGSRRTVAAGEYLYRQGDARYDFYVVVSGAVDIVVQADGEERVVAHFDPGKFLGELNLLTGQRVFVSARVVEPGEVIVVAAQAIRHIIATNPRLRDTILAASFARRSRLLSGAATSIRLVGSRFSPESLRLREFLARNRIPHEWIDAEGEAAGERLFPGPNI